MVTSFTPPLRTSDTKRTLTLVYHKDTIAGFLATDANGLTINPFDTLSKSGYIKINNEEVFYNYKKMVTKLSESTALYPYLEDPTREVVAGVYIPVTYVKLFRYEQPYVIIQEDFTEPDTIIKVSNTIMFPEEFVAQLGVEVLRVKVLDRTTLQMTYPLNGRTTRPFSFIGSPSTELFIDTTTIDTDGNVVQVRTWKAGTPLYIYSYGPGFGPYTYFGETTDPITGARIAYDKATSLATAVSQDSVDLEAIKTNWLPRTSAFYDVHYGENDKFIRRFNSYIPSVYWDADSEQALRKFMDSIGLFYDGMHRDLNLLEDFNYKKSKEAWLPYLLRTLGWMAHTTDPDFWRWQARYAFSLFQRKGQDRELRNLLKLLKVDFSYLEKWRDENGDLTEYEPELVQYSTDRVPAYNDALYYDKVYSGTCITSTDMPYNTIVDTRKNFELNELVSVDDPYYYYDKYLNKFLVLNNTSDTITVENRELAIPNDDVTRTLNMARAEFPADNSYFKLIPLSPTAILLTGTSLPVGYTPWALDTWTAGDYLANLTVSINLGILKSQFNNLPIDTAHTYTVPVTPSIPIEVSTIISSGAVAIGEYYYKYTIVVPSGLPAPSSSIGESALSTIASEKVTLTAQSNVTLILPDKDIATQEYNIYRADTATPIDSDYQYIGITNTTTFIDDVAVPGVNYVNNYNIPYFMIYTNNIIDGVNYTYGPSQGTNGYCMSVSSTVGTMYIPAPINWYTDLWNNGATLTISDLVLGNVTNTITDSYLPYDPDTGVGITTIANAIGSYSYSLTDDIYWIAPGDSVNIYPLVRRVRINGSNLSNLDFTKYQRLISISGNISTAVPVVTPEVKVKVTGTDYYTTTDTYGNYTIRVPENDTYTLELYKDSTSFAGTLSVVVTDTDVTGVNFVSSAATGYTISGTITVGGVALSGALVSMGFKETTTSITGTYSFTGVPDGTYYLNASLAGYTFTADSITVIVSGANSISNDFTGALDTTIYTVSGALTLLSNAISYDWTTSIVPLYEFRYTLAGTIPNGPDKTWALNGYQITNPNVQMYMTDAISSTPLVYVTDMPVTNWGTNIWTGGTLINTTVSSQYYPIISSGTRELVIDAIYDTLTLSKIFTGAIILTEPIQGSYFISRESGIPNRVWYGKEGGTYRVPKDMGDQLYCVGTITSPQPYDTITATNITSTLPIMVRTPDQEFSKRIHLYINGTEIKYDISGIDVPITSMDGILYTISHDDLKLLPSNTNITITISPYDSKDTHISQTISITVYIKST
jgi:hypothetical protein